MIKEGNIEFDRSKIYEKLEFLPKPPGYNSRVPWKIQNQIAATNGRHYEDRIGKLREYPVYQMPVKRVNGEKLLLDIGSGWGRWLIGGSNRGYIPVGMDLRLEFCEAQQQVMKDFKVKGYSVVGDLADIPFSHSVFDLVWSFSVIQHTHYDRLNHCLQDINRVLTKRGYTKLEFPNKNGIRNRRGPVQAEGSKKDDYNSWCVRYYTPAEYRRIFDEYLSGFSFENHSFLGIGVLKEDLRYVSVRYWFSCLASLILSSLTSIVPALKYYSDSIYIQAKKKSHAENNPKVNEFLNLHRSAAFDNLNIVPLLKCPVSGGGLILNKDRSGLISDQAGVFYPVVNRIPILIKSEARSL